jgi:hypothetical chaperone protein
MTPFVAGLDFGTSNSAIGYATAGAVRLYRHENGSQAIPTALFWDDEDKALFCGQEAETRFLQGHEGRYLRALKSILGTSLAEDATRLGGRSWTFRSLLVRFVADLKNSVEKSLGAELTRLVAGRPVRFVDDDDRSDAAAESLLLDVLEECGFRDVQFIPEPVAALIDSEQHLHDARFILVADIGGGTSDFSLARRSGGTGPNPAGRFDVLANHGTHIGGTDLDRSLSLHAVMPHLGYGSRMRASASDAALPVPAGYFVDLATWQKIPFCYAPARRREVRTVLRHALEPEKLGRLVEVLERQLGHDLATAVERAKMALSSGPAATLAFADIADMPAVDVSREALARCFGPSLEQIALAARRTLAMAGVPGDRIDHLVLTGGSTLLPDVRQAIVGCVQNARIVASDPFVAVARGLTKAAQRTFLDGGA